MAKAVVFTLSFTFLALLLIASAIFIKFVFLNTEDRATELIISQRVYNIDHSLQKTINSILKESGSFALSKTNTSITIQDTLPNSAETKNQLFTDLKNLVEPDESIVQFSESEFSEIPILIQPYNFSYSHPDNNTITLTPSSQNYKKYNFEFKIENPGSTGTITWNTYSTGSIPVTITSTNSTSTITSTENINPSEPTSISINNIEGTNGITIDITNAIAAITTTTTIPLTTNITIDFTPITDNPQPQAYLQSVYTIDFSSFKTTKTGLVQIN